MMGSAGVAGPGADRDVLRSVAEVDFAVVDLQTTGLYPDRGDRICEVAVAEVAGANPAEPRGVAWHRLVNPMRSMTRGARAVNSITDEMLVGAPPFARLAPDLWLRLRGRVLVAHNALFAVGHLRGELGALGFPVEELLVVDTLVLAKNQLLDRPELGYLLDDLAVRLGISGRRRHRAEHDSLLTAAVFGALLASRGGEARLTDLFPRPADAHLRSPDPFGQVLLTIEQAIAERMELAIRYYSPWRGARLGAITERQVEPLGISDDYYLVAYCRLRQAERRFRIDRIKSARVVPSRDRQARPSAPVAAGATGA